MNIRTLCIAMLLAACGKGGGEGKTATIDLFGKKPMPPGDLAKIKEGMTQDDVKALFKDIKPTPNSSGSPSLRVPSPYSNAEYDILFYEDQKTVAHVAIKVPKDLAAQLEKAWGPGTKGPMGPEWVNQEDGYRVEAWDMGRKTEVQFYPFTPLNAVYFGAKPAAFDVLAKVKPGMSREEIAKAAPGFEIAGPPKGNGSYVPYEGKAKDVRFDIEYDQDDKARAFHVELPEGGGAMLTKAWGEHAGKARGTGTPMQCWDLADGTRFELQDDRLTYTAKENSVCDVAP